MSADATKILSLIKEILLLNELDRDDTGLEYALMDLGWKHQRIYFQTHLLWRGNERVVITKIEPGVFNLSCFYLSNKNGQSIFDSGFYDNEEDHLSKLSGDRIRYYLRKLVGQINEEVDV